MKENSINKKNKIPLLMEWGIHLAVIVIISITLFYKFRFGYPGCMAFFDDDFFYYLKIAENIYRHGFSSFNNLYPTNGYNPLWMAFLVPMLIISGGSGLLFFVLISVIICVSMIMIYIISRNLFSKFIDGTLISSLYASFVTYLSLLISWGGMEVHLTILLTLLIILYLVKYGEYLDNPKRTVVLGLLSSLMILSRLDSFIIVLLILMFVMIKNCKSLYDYCKRVLYFAAGGIVLPAYLVSNMVIFNTIMPISGMAKHLKSLFSFSSRYFETIGIYLKVNIYGSSFIISTLTLTIAASVGSLLLYKKVKGLHSMRVLFICIAFPLIFVIMQSFISDFPIWPWYLYPWIISFIASIIVLHHLFKEFKLFKNALYIALLSVSLVSFYGYIVFRNVSEASPEANSIYAGAVKIAEYLKNDNESIVGIGDRAGIVSYLIKNPVIQLEGLVMDREYLQHIKNQDDLMAVLKKYGVRYYVTHDTMPDFKNCYHVEEPSQGGRLTKKMKGTICLPPVYECMVNRFHIIIFRI